MSTILNIFMFVSDVFCGVLIHLNNVLNLALKIEVYSLIK